MYRKRVKRLLPIASITAAPIYISARQRSIAKFALMSQSRAIGAIR